MANPRPLTRHRTDLLREGRQGAARRQGRRLGGPCGRRMTLRSQGPSAPRAAYPCHRRRRDDGQGGLGWSGPAGPLDAAVDTQGLTALTPANLALALAVRTQLEDDARELARHWPLQREGARDAAPRAERQDDAVEPANRLVARTLEPRWHATLPQVEALERASADARRLQRRAVSPQERQQILRLAADRPAVWHAPPTTPADRQELLRLLVQPIARTPVDVPHRQTRGQVLWHPEATTALWGPRPGQRDRLRTPANVVDAIASLATGRPDAASAAALNARGLRSGRDQSLTADAVAWLRDNYHRRKPGSDPRLAAHPEARPDGRSSTRALATRFGVTISTIHS